MSSCVRVSISANVRVEEHAQYECELAKDCHIF